MLIKDFSSPDSRSYSIRLSSSGINAVKETEDFANPLKSPLNSIDPSDLDSLFRTLSKLIYQLNQTEILTVQRICYACKFYKRTEKRDYCNMLDKELLNSEIRLDCPEFEEKPTGHKMKE